MTDDLSYRRNQLVNEGVSPIKETPYSASRLVIQEHKADKAGLHSDIRFDIGNKAVSFATKKGLPTEVGKPVMLFRQPDHVVSYMDWEGDIQKGEYGAGKVTKAVDVPVVLKATNDHIHFTVPSGDNKGTYVLLKQNENEWLAVRKKDFTRHWEERPGYKELSEVDDESKYIATEKIDGAHFLATINPNGIAYTSQRKSVNGELLAREDKMPHLRDLKAPKQYHGMTIRGEVWHDRGFNYTSGLLNAAPTKAVERQKEIGPLRFAPFRIAKGPNGEENLPYEEQLKILKDLSQNFPHYFEPPRMAEKSVKAFFDEIGAAKGEGAVLVDRATGDSYKMKHRYDYDLVVHEVVQGRGKYEDAAGALVLKDKTGRIVGKVGTGFTDDVRYDIINNPQKYIGKLVKVQSRKPLRGSLREPSYLGLTTDKNEPDEVV